MPNDTHLATLEMQKQIDGKIDTVDGKIDTLIERPAGSTQFFIEITCSSGYNSHTFTAKSEVDDTQYTAEAQEGKAVVKVNNPGGYTISNDFNEDTATVEFVDTFIQEVAFSEFNATIKVTVPELLIGETIEAKDENSHTAEKKAESTEVSIPVYYKGKWTVGVKGNSFIETQNVTVSEEGETKEATLTVSSSGVPYIKVTLAEEFLNKTVTCKKDLIDLKKKNTTGEVSFLVPETGIYTVGLEDTENIQESVNVESAKEFSIELNLDDTTTPILIVSSKAEDIGKTIKVNKDAHNLEQTLDEHRRAMFVLPETGQWTITCDDYPEISKKVNATANKAYRVPLRASVFGIKVKQDEDDPKTRIIVDTEGDLNGLTPITVNTQDGTVNYGDMEDTFLFKAMNHVVLKSIDKSEEIELNPNDYSKKLEGGNAPDASATSNYNTFAKVEKLYTYEYSSGGYEYYYISDEKVDDNYTAVGFTKEDDSEADCFYMATHIGSYDSSNRLRSISGANIRNYTSYTDFSTAAKKNGEGYSMEQHQMINFYEIAYLMMVQDFNSQTAVGRGRDISGGSSSDQKATQTTGFANNKGPIAYDTESQAIKFMHVEDLWFNSGYSWEEGFVTQNSKVYVRMKPPYISEEAGGTSTYTEVTGAATKSGYISASVASNKWGRVPSAVDGSQTTFECDNFNLSTNSTLCACHRGGLGLFYRYFNTFSPTSNAIVARLSLLP